MRKDRRAAWLMTLSLTLLVAAVGCILFFHRQHSAIWERAAQIVLGLAVLALLALVFQLQRRNAQQVRQEHLRAQESDERLNLAMHNMTATIWDYDFKTKSIIQSGDSIRQHGFAAVVPNVPESLISCGYVHPDSIAAFRAMYEKLFAGEPRAEGVFRMRTADREDWWYEHIQYVNLFDNDGKPYRAIGMSRDVTDRQELLTAAQTDSLTGLLNHSVTMERIRRMLAQPAGPGVSALMIVDLDNFKQVNDRLGHQTGDETIARVAGIIRESFRSEDVVGRIGGDEFMIFLRHAPGVQIVRKKASQLVQALQIYCGDGTTGVAMSASVGVAVCGKGDDFEALYKRADVALYAAKGEGRNRYRLDDGTGVESVPAEAAQPESLSPIQLQSLLENIDGGVLLFEIGEELEVQYVSPGVYRFMHLPGSAPVTGKNLLLLIEQAYRAPLLACLREGAKGYEPVEFSYRAIKHGGGREWQHIRAVRIQNGGDRPVMIGVVTDISEIKKTGAMLDAIVENSPFGIGVFDVSAGFRPVFVNSVLLRMFKFTREEFFGNAGGNALSMVDPADVPAVREILKRVAAGNQPEEFVYHPAQREDMGRRSIRANGLRIPSSGDETLVLILFSDVTGQERGTRVYRSDAPDALPNTARRVLIVDDSRINRQILKRILSDDYEVLEAENGREALALLQQAGESVAAVLLDILMPVMDGYELLEIMRADAKLSHLPVIVTTASTDEGAEVRALSLGANDFIMKPYKPPVIKHRLANTIKLRENAAFVNSIERDSKTGVYSKEFFYQKAESTLLANPEQAYDVVCFDIERFKLINELYGEKTADGLLRYLAGLLVRDMRGHGVCGRVGTDKFACLLPHRDAYRKDAFVSAMQEVNLYPISHDIHISAGVYVVTDRMLPVSTMCDRALSAASSVKGKYDVYFAYYDDALMARAIKEQALVDGMKRGLTEREFVVYYQPKFNLATGALAGAEALVRWRHPELGLLLPGVFIPLFEKNGFITDLDRYVWETACRDLAAWVATGRAPVNASVNVSRTDVYNPELPEILLGLVRKYALEPKLLHLEITESAYNEDSGQLVHMVEQLKELGFLIEMDDFGTGYSSLNMLAELPINIVKLDMGFLRGDGVNPRKESILEAVLALSGRLGLPVVAEGVETKAQADKLAALGCGYAQGYYFSKPLPRDDFFRLAGEARLEEPK